LVHIVLNKFAHPNNVATLPCETQHSRFAVNSNWNCEPQNTPNVLVTRPQNQADSDKFLHLLS